MGQKVSNTFTSVAVYLLTSFESAKMRTGCHRLRLRNFESFRETSCYDVLVTDELNSTDFTVAVDSITAAIKLDNFSVGDL